MYHVQHLVNNRYLTIYVSPDGHDCADYLRTCTLNIVTYQFEGEYRLVFIPKAKK